MASSIAVLAPISCSTPMVLAQMPVTCSALLQHAWKARAQTAGEGQDRRLGDASLLLYY